ncbi:MAG: NifU family protein [Flavobacteriales bacterium]|jgi:Fe-S cluster biogenesis protein NfuA
MESIEQKVNSAISLIRPFLNDDGGDVELVEVTSDRIVKVRLTGSCKDCSMKQSTLRGGIEETIKKAVPEISAVLAVED